MKKLLISTILIGILFGLITVIGSLLFSFSVLSFASFGVIFIAADCVLGAVFILLLYVLSKLKEIERKKELEKAIEKERQMQLLSLYNRFGIEPQKDASGRLLNFYELLGIEPVFDEYGERVPTVYEILNILPKFDKDGKEVPCVVFIKNKSKGISQKAPEICLKLQTVESFKIVQAKAGKEEIAPAIKSAGGSVKKEETKPEGKKDKKKAPKEQKFSGMKTASVKFKPKSTASSATISAIVKDMFGNSEDYSYKKFKPSAPDKTEVVADKNPEVKPSNSERGAVEPPKVESKPEGQKKPSQKVVVVPPVVAPAPVPDPPKQNIEEEPKVKVAMSNWGTSDDVAVDLSKEKQEQQQAVDAQTSEIPAVVVPKASAAPEAENEESIEWT